MSLTDKEALAKDAVFLAKVTAAAVYVAVSDGFTIYGLESPTQANKMRLLLYKQILLSPTEWGAKFAYALACAGPADALSTDETIQFQVSEVAKIFAGEPI